MKAIQKELGEIDDVPNELEQLENRIKEVGMPKEALKKATAELNKLKMMSPMSAEASVVRSYLDWMVSVPWKKRSKVRHDLVLAEKILNEDHYGLDEVKERILEFLAVQSRVKKLKGPVLCLVGPPGVGKTSLGESIARATGRKFVRMSLGGVRDEAEIRGQRLRIRCSFLMKWTSWVWTIVAIPLLLCWKFLIQSKIIALTIII